MGKGEEELEKGEKEDRERTVGREQVQIGWRMWKRNGKGEERMENGKRDEGTSGTKLRQRAWSRCQLERAGVIGMEQVAGGPSPCPCPTGATLLLHSPSWPGPAMAEAPQAPCGGTKSPEGAAEARRGRAAPHYLWGMWEGLQPELGPGTAPHHPHWEGDCSPAAPVGRASARIPTWPRTDASTPGRSPSTAGTAGSASGRARHQCSTGGCTLGSGHTHARNAGRASASAPTTIPMAESGPTSALSAGTLSGTLASSRGTTGGMGTVTPGWVGTHRWALGHMNGDRAIVMGTLGWGWGGGDGMGTRTAGVGHKDGDVLVWHSLAFGGGGWGGGATGVASLRSC